MSFEPVRVASLGMGWWSDVLADAIQKTNKLKIISCYSRSEEKRNSFSKKYNCNSASSYEEILEDDSVEAIINTTPNHVHLETTQSAAMSKKHVFLDKPIAHTIKDGKKIAEICAKEKVILSIGYQRRRENQFRWIKKEIEKGNFGKMVQAECNISRDREGQFELGHWRYESEGMPGGVMLQIGIHYVDVLEFLMGPVKSVAAKTAQLVLPGENPDIANLILEHENGALSNLTASYASASEYYLMNIYGKTATAYFNHFDGLRILFRGEKTPNTVDYVENDTIVEELEEFANCVRENTKPEVDGFRAVESLAVIMAGVLSSKENRSVKIEEILEVEN